MGVIPEPESSRADARWLSVGRVYGATQEGAKAELEAIPVEREKSQQKIFLKLRKLSGRRPQR